jgi:hypothetical protein
LNSVGQIRDIPVNMKSRVQCSLIFLTVCLRHCFSGINILFLFLLKNASIIYSNKYKG